MLLWQMAERGAHQEGQPPMAGGDLVLRPLWEEDEAVPRSDQGDGALAGSCREAQAPFQAPWQQAGTVCSVAGSACAASQRARRTVTSLTPLYLLLVVPEPQCGTQRPSGALQLQSPYACR